MVAFDTDVVVHGCNEHFNMPEKFEAIHNKLFWNDEQRLHMLVMLLEAVGLKRALELCPPAAVQSALNR